MERCWEVVENFDRLEFQGETDPLLIHLINTNQEPFGWLLAQLYANIFHQYFPYSASLGLAKQSAITFDKSRRTNKEKFKWKWKLP